MDGFPYRRVARIPVLRIQPASDLSVHDSGERAANDLVYYRLVVLLAPMDPASTLERCGIRGSFCLCRDVDARYEGWAIAAAAVVLMPIITRRALRRNSNREDGCNSRSEERRAGEEWNDSERRK